MKKQIGILVLLLMMVAFGCENTVVEPIIFNTEEGDPTQDPNAYKYGLNTVTDIDGNIYQTVEIGDQTWMAENLKVTHYSDGTEIPLVTDDVEWVSLPTSLNKDAYSWYNNDEVSYKNEYGALYTWYVASSEHNVCPSGWHVSTTVDWEILNNYLGGYLISGAKLKEVGIEHWVSPNDNATDEFGFSALGGGNRDQWTARFVNLKYYGDWWHSDETFWGDESEGNKTHMRSADDFAVLSTYLKTIGHSIRCIKD